MLILPLSSSLPVFMDFSKSGHFFLPFLLPVLFEHQGEA